MKPSRRGYSLIEMLTVISVLSVMLAVSTVTIALLMRSERTGGDALATAQIAHRLGRQFREDVHDAHNATVALDNRGQSVLKLENNQRPNVTWSRVSTGVRRSVTAQPVRIETYRIPISDVSFALVPVRTSSPQNRLITLTTVPDTRSRQHASDAWPVRITAVMRRETPP